MAKYITRIGHLKQLPNQKVGDIVYPKTELGEMGMTGQTTVIHGHIDTIRVDDFLYINRFPDQIWRSYDYENGRVTAAPEQTDYLIGEITDTGLFGCKRKILHPYHDSGYTIAMNGKRHWGTDVDSTDPNRRIFMWNRSFKATLLDAKLDPLGGYGFYICVGYER